MPVTISFWLSFASYYILLVQFASYYILLVQFASYYIWIASMTFLSFYDYFPLYSIIRWWKITTETQPHCLPLLPSNRTCPCHTWSTASFVNWVNYHGPVQIRSGYKDYTPSIVLCRDINRVKQIGWETALSGSNNRDFT